jgi:oligopeptide transport system substrate-binding protein
MFSIGRLGNFILLGCALLLGCGEKSSKTLEANVLRIGNATEPQTLDPHLAVDLQQIAIARGLFEGLVLLDDRTLEPIPGAAERWELSPDGLTYTFYLRPDCRWSDGSPLTAEDFAYSMRRALSPELASPMAEMLFCLRNGRDFYGGTASWESVGVAASDALTLQLTLERPTAYFLSLLAHPICSPVQRKCVERYGSMTSRDSPWSRAGSMVSNGPYGLREWRVGDRVQVEQNPYHRDRDGPASIVFYPLCDAATEQNAFENGEIDVTATIPPDRIAALHRDDPKSVQEVESLGIFYYLLRCDCPPLNDVHLRRALSLSIDRCQLCRLLDRADAFAAGNLVPPGCGAYSYAGDVHAYDPDRARKELARSACGGAGKITLSLTVNSAPQHRLIAQAIQDMWRRELAIAVELRSEEWKSFLLTRRAGNFTVARGGWIGDYNDPTTFLDLFRSGSANNFTRWRSAAYDRELNRAEGETDPALRRSHFQRAEAILLKETPIIPLYFETAKHRVARRVSGWNANLLDYHLYQNVRLSPRE